MIFEQICITNLFSYYGEQAFNLPEPTPEKPVVLIAGRNGFGKTSFINSVKLLFLGTADEMMEGIQAGRKLRPSTYLLGLDREWQGVFNRRARLENRGDARFGVRIVWREEQGRVTAQRFWTLKGNEPEAHLQIETDFDTDFGRSLTDPEIVEEFLERRLPKNIVRFFFYDGEQIQTIAEANREGQLKQIERLLDIAAIDTLNEYLQKAVAEWKQDGLAAEALAELSRLRAQHQLSASQHAASLARHDEVAADIEDLDRDIRRNERQLDAIRSKSLQRDEPRLRTQLKTSRDNYEEACRKVADTLPQAAPLWAATALVSQVAQALGEASGNPGHLLADEIKGILLRLPERLLDEPPHPIPALSEPQKALYRRKLAAIFSQYTEPPSGGFFSLSPARTTDLKRRFDYYAQASNERARLAEDLRHATRMSREAKDAQLAIDAVGDASPEEQKAFKERQQAILDASGKRTTLLVQSGAIEHEIKQTESEMAKLEVQIAQQETRQVKLSINSARIKRAREAQHLFETYKHQLKQTRRAQIEETINRRFKALMTSHALIDRIEVDEDFALTYRDVNGAAVGMANISAGMKQLTAQALLWALSETTARHVPIIVDTPLARIDRQHQENLLANYYPQAGAASIHFAYGLRDRSGKYRLLQPHIGAEFRLQNADGDDTEIVPDSRMYDLEAA